MAKVGVEGLVVEDLTLPKPGSTSTRALIGRHVRKSLEIALELPARALQSREAKCLTEVKALVRALWGDAAKRRQLLTTLNNVAVSGPLHAAYRACKETGQIAKFGEYTRVFLVQALTQLSFHESMSGEEIVFHGSSSGLALPQLNVSMHPKGDLDGICFSDGALRLFFKDGQEVTCLWSDIKAGHCPEQLVLKPSFFSVANQAQLATFDTNPLSDFEAHPDKKGNQIDLGEKSAQEWAGVLVDAMSNIQRGLPDLLREMSTMMQLWVPVGVDPKQHLSASYQEAVGMAYLTLHPNLFTMTEAMIHEFQHNKANALLNLSPILENAFSPLYTSPLRPDPRPLHGIVLAVHAFLPVAELYFRLREQGDETALHPFATRRLKTIVEGNHQGMLVLEEHGAWTEVGARFFEQMKTLDRTHVKAIERC